MMWTRESDRQEVAPSQTRVTIRSKGRRRQAGSLGNLRRFLALCPWTLRGEVVGRR
jgi:hypothetical protein